MIKVLIIGNLPLLLGDIKGGVVSVIYNTLVGYSLNKELNVKVFSLTHDVKKLNSKYFSHNITIDYYPYGLIKSKKLGTLINGRKFLKRVIKEYKPDIIHFQGNGSIFLLSIGLETKNLLVTPHGMLKEEYKYAGDIMTKLNLLIAMRIESLLIKKFHNFIFIADYAKKYFFQTYKFLGPSNCKFEIIPNPLNQKFFTEPKFTEKFKNVIFVGGLTPRKGLDLLLSAIANIKTEIMNLSIIIVGGFYDRVYKEKIYTQIKKYNLSEMINLVGWKD